MLAHDLGFFTSIKMLTSERGWIKPILVLTLIGWIPILGQIVVFGYAYEWARYTAWGVDTAPRRHGFDYGKLLKTGGIAFLVTLTYDLAFSLIRALLFGASATSVLVPAAVLLGQGNMEQFGLYLAGVGVSGVLVSVLLGFVISLFTSAFKLVAMMRATVYDGFAAGWRLDRLFQMIGRDFSGFLHVLLVTLAGEFCLGVIRALRSFVSVGGLLGAVLLAEVPGRGAVLGGGEVLAVPFAVGAIAALLIAFALSALGCAMELVSINAAGQWFARFEVQRWGVSSDPLPEGVPARKRE